MNRFKFLFAACVVCAPLFFTSCTAAEDKSEVKMDSMLSISSGDLFYAEVKQAAEKSINNGMIDLSETSDFEEVKLKYKSEITSDILKTGQVSLDSNVRQYAEDYLYYDSFYKTQLEDGGYDPSSLSLTEQITLRDKCFMVSDELSRRSDLLFDQAHAEHENKEDTNDMSYIRNPDFQDKAVIIDLYVYTSRRINEFAEASLPTDFSRKFDHEYDSITGYLKTESGFGSVQKKYSDIALKEMEDLFSDVKSGVVSDQDGVIRIDTIWNNFLQAVSAERKKE